MDLDTRAWLGLAVVTGVMSLLLFGGAGTIDYWQAWVYLTIFFGASLLTTVHLMRKDRALLARLLRGGPMFEKRFRWSTVPLWAVLLGDVLVALGFYFIFLVYRENTFSAATIEVTSDQTVVSTGPYAIVRHPMYAGGILYMAGTPLALGSYAGFLALAAMLPFLLWRLLDEERILTRDLPGYAEYRRRVRHRLVPLVW